MCFLNIVFTAGDELPVPTHAGCKKVSQINKSPTIDFRIGHQGLGSANKSIVCCRQPGGQVPRRMKGFLPRLFIISRAALSASQSQASTSFRGSYTSSRTLACLPGKQWPSFGRPGSRLASI